MDMMAAFLKGLGISPEILSQTQQIFVGVAETVARIETQLIRIEQNTMMLLDGQGSTAPAGPSRYDIMPMLQTLPPMADEIENPERKAA